jgi:hypothetical protein
MGLKDSEWGQIGVTMIAGTLGWIMDAPAATAYAVLPVGVETMRPSNETHDAQTHIRKYKVKVKDIDEQSTSNSDCFALRERSPVHISRRLGMPKSQH